MFERKSRKYSKAKEYNFQIKDNYMDLFPEKTAIAQKSIKDLLALIQEAVNKLGTEFTEHDNF